MKIKIKNFGPINNFELDLAKNMTIVYGENNIGKSYSMSLAYLLINKLIEFYKDYHRVFPLIDYYKSFDIKDTKLSELKGAHQNDDFKEDIFKLTIEFLNKSLAIELDKSIRNTFGELAKYEGAEVTLHSNNYENIIYREFPELFNIIELKIEIKNGKILFKDINIDLERIIFRIDVIDKSFSFKGKNLYFYVKEFSDNPFKDIEFLVDKVLNILIDGIKHEFNVQNYFIPASRSGLYFGLKNFTSIFLEISKYRDHFPEGIKLSEITEPQSNYFRNLTAIENVTKQDDFLKIARTIERKLLNGSVEYKKEGNTLYYKENNSDRELQLDKTSSMVSEMSLITAFFKYVINSANIGYPKSTKPILFIEEPEAHLHPTKQILFAEILGEIVKTDSVRIVISSHSNYIFNKLNNMIMAKELDFDKYSAYVLKKGKGKGSMGKLLKTDELGTDDENFTDVSDQLYNERLSIINKMNKKNGKK